MFERARAIFAAAMDALPFLRPPPAVSVESRRGMLFGTARAGVGVAVSAVTGGDAPEGFSTQEWLELRECLGQLSSNVSTGRTNNRYAPSITKYSTIDFVSAHRGNNRDSFEEAAAANVVNEFKQNRTKLVELLKGREIPIKALPHGLLDVAWDDTKPANVTVDILDKYLPADSLDQGPGNLAKFHAHRRDQFAAQEKIFQGLEARAKAAGVPHHHATEAYNRILYNDGPDGETFDQRIMRHANNPSELDAAFKTQKNIERQKEVKTQRVQRMMNEVNLAYLSQLFGGMQFIQDPRSLRVYAVVDAANEEAAKAIGVVVGMIKNNTLPAETEVITLSEREKRAPLPTVNDLFKNYDSTFPHLPRQSAIGADVYLEMKPYVAQSIVDVASRTANMRKTGQTFGVLTDSFDILFEYGRGQAKQMGDKPLEYADRFKAVEPRTSFWGRG